MTPENTPFFSVILPTYNREDVIQNAIESVLNQKFENWELIIVDDGSTDNTVKIVKQYDDARIKYYWKKNEERSIARNFGIERAIGAYICFLDSDDEYLDNHFETLFNFIHNSIEKNAIFHTKAMHIKNGNKTIDKYYDSNEGVPITEYLLNANLIMNSICIYSSILEIDKFPEKFNIWEDMHLWMRIVPKHPFFQIETVTTIWKQNVERSIMKNKSDNIFKIYLTYLGCMNDFEKVLISDKRSKISQENFIKYKRKKFIMMLIALNRNHNHFKVILFAIMSFRYLSLIEVSKSMTFFVLNQSKINSV